jgi:hypothetical protein
MSAPKFIDIDGRRFVWRELLQRRREQVAAAKIEQPALFELKEDCRPMPERSRDEGSVMERSQAISIGPSRVETPAHA